MRAKKSFSAGKPTFAIFIALLLTSAIVPTQAQARKFKVLHTFHGANGAQSNAHLVRDAAGNLYGTTSVGGSGKGVCVPFGGCGTAFKLDKTGKQVWLHSFTGKNGMVPLVGLMRDGAGNLYGTTVLGGDFKCFKYGCGTVFKLDKTGKEQVLYRFTGGADGFDPEALLARDAAGNLYGTTLAGIGNVFKIDKTGKLTVFYTFTGGSDGCFPASGVILDATGNLYGVAAQGGVGFCNSGYGTVFELDTTGKFTVLHTFDIGDGAYPGSLLLFDSAGNLYGTTSGGGNSFVCGSTGCGTVFELSPLGNGNWTETVLYSFCSLENCADGEEPGPSPLARDSSGNLYGTTGLGGTSRCGGSGCGVVFKLEPQGKEIVLHSFTGGADGQDPSLGVILDKSGNLYGTTFFGGDRNCAPAGNRDGCGVVYKLTP
jgi:uncharacterized repeat protein (TIGR03803 family)